MIRTISFIQQRHSLQLVTPHACEQHVQYWSIKLTITKPACAFPAWKALPVFPHNVLALSDVNHWSTLKILRQIRHVRPKLPLLLFTSLARLILHSALPSAFQCCRKACLPPCLHVNNAPEGERQKSVSRSSLVCHLPSPCISPDRQPPLKRGEKNCDHRTPRVSLVQKHEYFTYLHPYSPPLPPPPIFSPLILRLSAFAFHMPG